MKIQCAHTDLIDVDLLVPNPKNPNSHPDAQIRLLAKIMGHQGWRSPIVVSNRSGFVVKGHGRLMAAKLNGWAKAPVDRQNYASEADEYADMVADNKIAELSETDMVSVNRDALELGPDFDLELLGIPDFELIETEELEPQCDEDEVPDHVEPRTKPGDVYQLGRHRLMCGDSTSVDAIDELLAGSKPDMVFTDPPYNIDYQGVQDKKDKIANDKMSDDDFLDFLRQTIMPSDVMYVCCSWQFAHLFKQAMADLGRPAKAMIVWDKVNPAQHLDRYFKQHEIIFYHGPFGGNKTLRGDVWQLKRQKNTVHPTMKPVELIEMALEDNPDKKRIYDGFGGSGSTLIAAEKNGRAAFLMELDPKYCDVIVARWEKYTGKKAELVSG